MHPTMSSNVSKTLLLLSGKDFDKVLHIMHTGIVGSTKFSSVWMLDYLLKMCFLFFIPHYSWAKFPYSFSLLRIVIQDYWLIQIGLKKPLIHTLDSKSSLCTHFRPDAFILAATEKILAWKRLWIIYFQISLYLWAFGGLDCAGQNKEPFYSLFCGVERCNTDFSVKVCVWQHQTLSQDKTKSLTTTFIVKLCNYIIRWCKAYIVNKDL